ncbi:hypothetical protein CN191_27205 [Sinorhizobium meliloti]|nr:hypothetical protein CDO23_21690 [Sinorhizobium meliloti]RVI72538.1 hypothetical protein CN191_27205 [Sinorhizobium meliloti]
MGCDRRFVADPPCVRIVISVSVLHPFASVRRGQEPVLVQALGSDPAVECFDVGTAPRLTHGSPGSRPCP